MDGVITKYLYDGMNIIAEMDVNNNITKTYTHNLAIDDPLAITTNGQTYYYHKDALGTITSLTDSTGTIVQKYEYDSFGNIVSVLNPNFIQPYTFTGREYDPETGTYHYRARTFDSKTGTFISKDPISFAGGDVNLYRYVGNDPINWVDPFGLYAQFVLAEAAKDVVIIGGLTAAYLYFVSPAGQEMLAQNTKDVIKVIEGLIEPAKEHAKKCSASPSEDPNQNKWRKEIKAFLDRAKRLAEKRLPGKLKEQVLKTIEQIENSIPK